MPNLPSRSRQRLATLGAALSLLLVAGCAPTRVAPVDRYDGTQLARPDLIVVEGFAVDRSEVKLDSGLRSRLTSLFSGASSQQRQDETGRKVATAITESLVAEIRKMGLDAVTADDVVPTAGQRRLRIEGQIVSIDEGNATRRNLVGFGAGRSGVDILSQVYYEEVGGNSRLLESFEADAESSRKPGAAATMGVGAAADHAASSAVASTGLSAYSELTSADVGAEGKRIGRELAKHLESLFTRQGWIAPPTE
jgi:hypothetical protein